MAHYCHQRKFDRLDYTKGPCQPSTPIVSRLSGSDYGRPFEFFTNGPQYRNNSEQALSCASREGKGKCGPHDASNAAQHGQIPQVEVGTPARAGCCFIFHTVFLDGRKPPRPLTAENRRYGMRLINPATLSLVIEAHQGWRRSPHSSRIEDVDLRIPAPELFKLYCGQDCCRNLTVSGLIHS